MNLHIKRFKESETWNKDLNGFFELKGKKLSDDEARFIIHYCIINKIEYLNDLPDNKAAELLGWIQYATVRHDLARSAFCWVKCHGKPPRSTCESLGTCEDYDKFRKYMEGGEE